MAPTASWSPRPRKMPRSRWRTPTTAARCRPTTCNGWARRSASWCCATATPGTTCDSSPGAEAAGAQAPARRRRQDGPRRAAREARHESCMAGEGRHCRHDAASLDRVALRRRPGEVRNTPNAELTGPTTGLRPYVGRLDDGLGRWLKEYRHGPHKAIANPSAS